MELAHKMLPKTDPSRHYDANYQRYANESHRFYKSIIYCFEISLGMFTLINSPMEMPSNFK